MNADSAEFSLSRSLYSNVRTNKMKRIKKLRNKSCLNLLDVAHANGLEAYVLEVLQDRTNSRNFKSNEGSEEKNAMHKEENSFQKLTGNDPTRVLCGDHKDGSGFVCMSER